MRHEQSGVRDLSMNIWHRVTFDDDAKAFDVDLVDICHICAAPLYCWEATRSQQYKATSWTENVANKLNIPAYLIVYALDDPELSQDANVYLLVPCQNRCLLGKLSDLERHIKAIRLSHARLWHPRRNA